MASNVQWGRFLHFLHDCRRMRCGDCCGLQVFCKLEKFFYGGAKCLTRKLGFVLRVSRKASASRCYFFRRDNRPRRLVLNLAVQQERVLKNIHLGGWHGISWNEQRRSGLGFCEESTCDSGLPGVLRRQTVSDRYTQRPIDAEEMKSCLSRPVLFGDIVPHLVVYFEASWVLNTIAVRVLIHYEINLVILFGKGSTTKCDFETYWRC